MDPGKLNKRITFQLQDLDLEVEDWKVIATTWASINPISGKEY